MEAAGAVHRHLEAVGAVPAADRRPLEAAGANLGHALDREVQAATERSADACQPWAATLWAEWAWLFRTEVAAAHQHPEAEAAACQHRAAEAEDRLRQQRRTWLAEAHTHLAAVAASRRMAAEAEHPGHPSWAEHP